MSTVPLWMALGAALPPHWSPIKVYFGITIILSIVGWCSLARVVRGKLLQLKVLDGPDAIRHLDSLLSLPKLSGIQWIPGAGSPPMSEWIPLLKRIQKAGKLQHLICQKGEVRKLLRELEPEGILLDTICESVKEADQLISEVRRWI